MNGRHTRVFYPLLIVTVVGLLSFLGPLSGSSLQNAPDIGPISRLSPVTPTPVPTPGSVPGSTDGIMWMGVVISLIILLPLLLSRGTWSKS